MSEKSRLKNVSTLSGMHATPAMLADIPTLEAAYFSGVPYLSIPAQRVSFGTSWHRGSALQNSFNEWRVLAIIQAICLYRNTLDINGPLFLGIDTHVLSAPACASALEVLAANCVEVMIATHDEYTSTPVISHAILAYNQSRVTGLADGIVITPSHNPPEDGGIKYNPPNGGPAGTIVTGWIEAKANAILKNNLRDVSRMPAEKALCAATTHRHDYLNAYINYLGSVVDMEAIRNANLRLDVDPLGDAGVYYWAAIGERYGLNITVVNDAVDPTFGFIPLDWDGRIRMDPSSSYAMQNLISLKHRFDVAFASDTDHDRHGIVTPSLGLLPANHYLSVAIDYLFEQRPNWRVDAAVGKTVVSSQMIDRVAARLGRKLVDMPAGFKWFADGLFDGSLGFGGEESAGVSFLRRDGSVWTTDKDGIVAALLSAEITARLGRDPGEYYQTLTQEFGDPVFDRIDAFATAAQKNTLSRLSAQQIRRTDLAGEKNQHVLSQAAGNGIGGVKVSAESGWFVARPSGTEMIYKIYAESFIGEDHLCQIVDEAQAIVDEALQLSTPPGNG